MVRASNKAIVAAAAAQTTTRAGRQTKSTKAAKQSVRSEENLEQGAQRANVGKKTKKRAVNRAPAQRALKSAENLPLGSIVIAGKKIVSGPEMAQGVASRPHLANVTNPGPKKSYAAAVTGLGGPSDASGRVQIGGFTKAPISTPILRKTVGISHTQPIIRIIANEDSYVPATGRASTVSRPAPVRSTVPVVSQPSLASEGDTESEEEGPAVGRPRLSDTESEVEFRHPSRSSHSSRRRLIIDDNEDDIIIGDNSPSDEEGLNDVERQFASPAEEAVDARGHVAWDTDSAEDEDDLRAEDSSSEDDNGPVAVPGKRKRSHGKRQRSTSPIAIKRARPGAPKASDFNAETETLLNDALGIFRARCVAKVPFATADEMIDEAEAAWEDARKAKRNLKPSRGVPYSTVVRRGSSQVRGQVRDQTRPRVADCYGFEERPNSEVANINRYLALIKDNAFLYADVSGLEGPFYHPLVFKILKATFFAKSSSDGAAYQMWFNPIRAETIALICTTIRLSLDEWQTGTFKSVKYDSNLYLLIYNVILDTLKYLGARDPEYIKGLGEELWEDCMRSYQIEGGLRPPAVAISEAKAINAVRYAVSRRNQCQAELLAAAAHVAHPRVAHP